MRAHAFLHVSFEGLGTIEPWLVAQGYQITYTRFYEQNASFPKLEEIDFLIVMGGPMSVNDEAAYPWLAEEKAWIRSMIASCKPVLGICLGAQLIASALGSAVYPNREKEIGWFPIVSARNDTQEGLFAFSHSLEVFHWHGETFDLPRDAFWLAKSDACAHQAFQVGKNVIGLQFHLEMTEKTIASIVKNCRDELLPSRYVQNEEAMFLRIEERTQRTEAMMHTLLEFLHVTSKTF